MDHMFYHMLLYTTIYLGYKSHAGQVLLMKRVSGNVGCALY